MRLRDWTVIADGMQCRWLFVQICKDCRGIRIQDKLLYRIFRRCRGQGFEIRETSRVAMPKGFAGWNIRVGRVLGCFFLRCCPSSSDDSCAYCVFVSPILLSFHHVLILHSFLCPILLSVKFDPCINHTSYTIIYPPSTSTINHTPQSINYLSNLNQHPLSILFPGALLLFQIVSTQCAHHHQTLSPLDLIPIQI